MEIDRIYCEDCIEGMKRIPDGAVDCIIADPPYFTGVTHSPDVKARLSDALIVRPFYREFFRECRRVLSDEGALYFFCNWQSQGIYLWVMNEEFPARNCLVWDKMGGMGNFYTMQHEMILFATKDNHWSRKGEGKAKNVISGIPGFSFNARLEGGKMHPTQKPVALIEKLIKDATNEGDVVLDPFMGSGTTAVAALKTERHFIGFEIHHPYADICERRIREARRKCLEQSGAGMASAVDATTGTNAAVTIERASAGAEVQMCLSMDEERSVAAT